MKNLLTLALVATACTAFSMPVKWRVKADETASKTITAYRGETLVFEPEFIENGSVVSNLTLSLCYQTNGMGSAWWTLPGTTFAPTNDCGASSYRFFVRATATNEVIYRANGILKLLGSPGATPNVIDLPVETLDLNAVEILNAPWATPADIATAVSEIDLSPYATTAALADAAKASTNYTDKVKQELEGTLSAMDDVVTDLGGNVQSLNVTAATKTELASAAKSATNYTATAISSLSAQVDKANEAIMRRVNANATSIDIVAKDATNLVNAANNATLTAAKSYTDSKVGDIDFSALATTTALSSAATAGTNYTDSVKSSLSTSIATKADTSTVTALSTTVSGKADAATVTALSSTVATWQSYWSGDDVRVTVTNYYGNLDHPALYLEQKMDADDDHDDSWFKTIWDERTRWNAFLAEYATVTNEVYNNFADRAWGVYDSATGKYSPDDVLQISQGSIVIANGMSYQKTVLTDSQSVWVLTANDPTTVTGTTDASYFRIADGDGATLFEIVKGDKKVVGASATAVDTSTADGTTSLIVTYAIVSEEHPTLSVCLDLAAGEWQTEDALTYATVEWSGQSGAWVATVTPTQTTNKLFAKATYEIGGSTYINNSAPVALTQIVIGGVTYTATVEEIDGKKHLILND